MGQQQLPTASSSASRRVAGRGPAAVLQVAVPSGGAAPANLAGEDPARRAVVADVPADIDSLSVPRDAEQRFTNAVYEAVESARRGVYGTTGKGPGRAHPPTVIVGVGDPPEVPYLVGPPGDRDLLVVRYREMTDVLPVARDADASAGDASSRRRGGRRGGTTRDKTDVPAGQPNSVPAAPGATAPPTEQWVTGWAYAKKCRDGADCPDPSCGFTHPRSWVEANAQMRKGAAKGKSKSKPDRSVKGPTELDDRSYHRTDWQGQKIGRRRQNEARAREQFFGTVLDADGNEVINDGDYGDSE